MRCHNKIQLLSIMNNHLVVYPTPMNLNWSWNGGSLAGIMLASQMLTGILLAMHYVSHVDYAFASVQHLMTDVPSGMILRYAHANGASLFFVVVYAHILRGMYYNSGAQPRELVWITGVVILLVMIITAFIGYVLPWGQMSFWGATVITSLATAIPVVGKSIMYWLWGGFSVDNPTLNRFYSFHYLLPFVLAGLSVFHIAALHQYGSTNPLGINSQSSSISFGVYFGVKDLLGALFLAGLFSYLVFFNPDLLGHPDNMIPANPYSTPQHIVPEWYVLWVYAILRSIPNKAMGVLAIGLVFASLVVQPFIGMGGGKFKVATEWLFWSFMADLFLLTWLGGMEIGNTTMFVGQVCTAYLFLYLLVLTPIVGWLESRLVEGPDKVQGSYWVAILFMALSLLAVSPILIGILKAFGFWFMGLLPVAFAEAVVIGGQNVNLDDAVLCFAAGVGSRTLSSFHMQHEQVYCRQSIPSLLPAFLITKGKGQKEVRYIAVLTDLDQWSLFQFHSQLLAEKFLASCTTRNYWCHLSDAEGMQNFLAKNAAMNLEELTNLAREVRGHRLPASYVDVYSMLPESVQRLAFNKVVKQADTIANEIAD